VSIPLRHEQPPVALDPLYRELHLPLLRFAEGLLGNRSDAEEAVQDAFVALARTGHVDEPRAWLFRVTRNSAVSVIRRRRGSVSLETVAAEPHRTADLSSEIGVLRVALATLPERNRSALLLRELSGMSYREIAGTIDVSEANVKVLIFRARQALQSVTDALSLRCADAQLALSAAADGEARLGEHARAVLHRAHCPSCRRFAGSIGGQRAGLTALFPMPMSMIGMPTLHVAHTGSAGATAGGAAGAGGATAGGAVAGGGLLGAKALLAAGAAAVAIGGGAAALDSHALGRHHHAQPAAPKRPAARTFAPITPPVATKDEPVFTRGAAGTDSNSTDGGSDTLARSGGDQSSTGDGSSTKDGSTSSPGDSTDSSGTTLSGDGGSSSSGSDTTTAPTSGDGGNGSGSTTDGGSGSGDGGATTGN
jgi:RNA polymerase sigma factor (sigma-70 family)